MIAKFQINNEDLIAQQEDAIRHTTIHRKIRIVQLVLTLAIIVLFLVLGDFSIGNIFFGLALYTICLPLIWKSYERAMMKRFKRDIIKEHKNKVGHFTATLSEEGITKESTNRTKKTTWSAIRKVTEDKQRYFLYVTDLDVFIIKKYPDNMDEKERHAYQAFLRKKCHPLIENKRKFRFKINRKYIFSIFTILLFLVVGTFVYRWAFPPEMSETYSGESEHWKVEDYQVTTSERFRSRVGEIYMKGETEFWADYFKLSAHIVIKNQESELRLYEYELEADSLPSWEKEDVMDIAQIEASFPQGGLYLTKFWMPMTINNIEQLYMTVQWKGKGEHRLNEEKIILTPNET